MLSLAEYEKIANKLIYSWFKRNGHFKRTDELIGRVVRFMAVADWKYDEKKSKLSREKFRRMRGLYAIREYLKPSKRKFIPLHDNMYNQSDEDTQSKSSRKVDFLIKNSLLSSRELSVVYSMLSASDLKTTSEGLGITYDQCCQLYKSAINKMKRISNVE